MISDRKICTVSDSEEGKDLILKRHTIPLGLKTANI